MSGCGFGPYRASFGAWPGCMAFGCFRILGRRDHCGWIVLAGCLAQETGSALSKQIQFRSQKPKPLRSQALGVQNGSFSRSEEPRKDLGRGSTWGKCADLMLSAHIFLVPRPQRSPLLCRCEEDSKFKAGPSVPGCRSWLFLILSFGSEALAQVQQRHGEVREEDEAHLLGEADVQLPWRRPRGKAHIEEPLREVRQGGCQVLGRGSSTQVRLLAQQLQQKQHHPARIHASQKPHRVDRNLRHGILARSALEEIPPGEATGTQDESGGRRAEPGDIQAVHHTFHCFVTRRDYDQYQW